MWKTLIIIWLSLLTLAFAGFNTSYLVPLVSDAESSVDE